MIDKQLLQDVTKAQLQNLKAFILDHKQQLNGIAVKVSQGVPLDAQPYGGLNENFLLKIQEYTKIPSTSLDTEVHARSPLNKLFLRTLSMISLYAERAIKTEEYTQYFGLTKEEKYTVAIAASAYTSLMLISYFNDVKDFDEETLGTLIKVLVSFSSWMQANNSFESINTAIAASGHLLFSTLTIVLSDDAIH